MGGDGEGEEEKGLGRRELRRRGGGEERGEGLRVRVMDQCGIGGGGWDGGEGWVGQGAGE